MRWQPCTCLYLVLCTPHADTSSPDPRKIQLQEPAQAELAAQVLNLTQTWTKCKLMVMHVDGDAYDITTSLSTTSSRTKLLVGGHEPWQYKSKLGTLLRLCILGCITIPLHDIPRVPGDTNRQHSVVHMTQQNCHHTTHHFIIMQRSCHAPGAALVGDLCESNLRGAPTSRQLFDELRSAFCAGGQHTLAGGGTLLACGNLLLGGGGCGWLARSLCRL